MTLYHNNVLKLEQVFRYMRNREPLFGRHIQALIEAFRKPYVFQTLEKLASNIKGEHKHEFEEKQPVFPARLGEEFPKTYKCSIPDCDVTAYYCSKCNGFIRGKPISEPYDETSFLAGSSGEKYVCGVCHSEIGREIEEQC